MCSRPGVSTIFSISARSACGGNRAKRSKDGPNGKFPQALPTTQKTSAKRCQDVGCDAKGWFCRRVKWDLSAGGAFGVGVRQCRDRRFNTAEASSIHVKPSLDYRLHALIGLCRARALSPSRATCCRSVAPILHWWKTTFGNLLPTRLIPAKGGLQRVFQSHPCPETLLNRQLLECKCDMVDVANLVLGGFQQAAFA